MTIQLNCEKIEEALRDLKRLTDFAYAQGYHEMGYDPWQVVADEIKSLTDENFRFCASDMRKEQLLEKWLGIFAAAGAPTMSRDHRDHPILSVMGETRELLRQRGTDSATPTQEER